VEGTRDHRNVAGLVNNRGLNEGWRNQGTAAELEKDRGIKEETPGQRKPVGMRARPNSRVPSRYWGDLRVLKSADNMQDGSGDSRAHGIQEDDRIQHHQLHRGG
jgi:hypothetical protein